MDICAISNKSRVWSPRGEMRLVTRRTFLSRGTGAVAPIFDSDESRPPITLYLPMALPLARHDQAGA